MKTYQQLENEFRDHWFQKSIRSSFLLERFWYSISCNPNVSDDIIKNNPDCPWEDMGLIYNDTLSWSLIKSRISDAKEYGDRPFRVNTRDDPCLESKFRNSQYWKSPQAWKTLSEHPSISIQSIDDFPDKPWDWYEIYQHPNITLKDIQSKFIHKDNPIEEKLILSVASTNPNINLEYMMSRMDIPWRIQELSRTGAITIRDIIKYPNLYWDGENLSHNPNINFDFVRKTANELQDPFEEPEHIFNSQGCIENLDRVKNLNYTFLSWDWSALSKNKAIKLSDIEQNIDLDWDWKSMTYHPDLTIEFVLKHKDRPWNWKFLQIHPHITVEDILTHFQTCDINWDMISSNPNIGWDTVEKYKFRPWNWEKLYCNPMTGYRDRWISEKRLQWIAANRIHRWYRMISWNPKYGFARAKILRELSK